MRITKSWLYYQILAIAALYLRPVDAAIIAWRGVNSAGSQTDYDKCLEVLQGWCVDDPGHLQNVQNICSNVQSDLTEGCTGNDQGALWYILEFEHSSFYCEANATLHRLHDCNSCTQNGGYPIRSVDLGTVCRNDKIDHWWPWSPSDGETQVDSIIDWMTQNGATCADSSTADSSTDELKVCISCIPTFISQDATWSVDSGYRMKRGITNSYCGTQETTYSYGCRANSYRPETRKNPPFLLQKATFAQNTKNRPNPQISAIFYSFLLDNPTQSPIIQT